MYLVTLKMLKMLITLKDKCNAGSFNKKMRNLKEINNYFILFSIFADRHIYNNIHQCHNKHTDN